MQHPVIDHLSLELLQVIWLAVIHGQEIVAKRGDHEELLHIDGFDHGELALKNNIFEKNSNVSPKGFSEDKWVRVTEI